MHPLKYLIPAKAKKKLKYIYHAFFDIVSPIKEPLIPPRTLNTVGSEDFRAVGKEFLEHFQTRAELRPSDRVLDIGCGVGRIAVPIAGYLDTGTYIGFDIYKPGIDWCAGNVTPVYEHFSFVHANVHNDYYNPEGTIAPVDFVFPCEDESIDFAFATSVFTHMMAEEVEQYLREIARVLASDGKALVTFFALPEDERCVTQHVDFQYRTKDVPCWYSHKECPTAELGFTEAWIEEALKANGLKIQEVYHGWWKQEKGASYQDMYLLSRV